MVLAQLQVGDAQRVPALQANGPPDAGRHVARAPVPAVVVAGLAHEVRRHRVGRLVAVGRGVIARELVRHRLDLRQQRGDRRMQHDAQLVAARAQPDLDRNAPGPEGVVGAQQLRAVQVDVGERVETVEDEVAARARERGGRRIEVRAVLPVGEAYPLQARFGRADIGVGDQVAGEQVGVHGAGHLRRVPRRRLWVRCGLRGVGQHTEGPALVDEHFARRGGDGRRGGERPADPQQPPHRAVAFQCRLIQSSCVGIAATALASVLRMPSTYSTRRYSGMSSTIGW